MLVNNATASALSAYVSQNYGAGKWKRIRQGVHAALIQTQCLNLMMGVGILLLRRPIVEMFLANPPKEVIWYSNGYLNWVAPLLSDTGSAQYLPLCRSEYAEYSGTFYRLYD